MTRFVQAPAIEQEELDERIVLTLDAERWITLAGTAAHLWRLLATPKSAGELLADCKRRYSGDGDQIEREVVATIDDWRRRGLVSVND